MGYSSSDPYLRVTDPTGASVFQRRGGAASVSNDDGVSFLPIDVAGRMFERETLAIARSLMPTLGFNRVMGTDFLPIWEAALSAANTPTIDGFFNGGVVQFSAGGANQIALNPVTPGAATYNPIIGNAFQTRATAWFIRGRFLINAPTLTAGSTELVLLSMDSSYVGGAGLGHSIQLVGMSSVHLNQFQIRTQGGNFAAGPNNFSLGQDGYLGGYNGLMPINQWFTACLFFDGVSLRWMFQDVYNPSNFLDARLGQMDSMPQDAAAVTVNSSPGGTPDITIGNNFKCDALAIAYCATLENK